MAHLENVANIAADRVETDVSEQADRGAASVIVRARDSKEAIAIAADAIDLITEDSNNISISIARPQALSQGKDGNNDEKEVTIKIPFRPIEPISINPQLISDEMRAKMNKLIAAGLGEKTKE